MAADVAVSNEGYGSGHEVRLGGAVAFSRTGDPATGDFRDASVLRKFGDGPDEGVVTLALNCRFQRVGRPLHFGTPEFLGGTLAD